MNFVKYGSSVVHISKAQIVFCFFLTLSLSIYLAGCSDQVSLPSPEGLAEFENAGHVRPSVDMGRLVRAKIGGGPYRVVPGEVLELTMPTILQVVTAEEPEISGKMAPYVCRISDAGTITLPVVGETKVEGKTLSEIESAVIDAYYPEYTVTRPSVFAQVLEYKTAKMSITGAVNKPGIYSLRSDQMSLVALLMEAGGIIDEGAALIRIIHADETVLNNVDAPRERVEQIIEHKPKETVLAVPLAHYPASNEIEVQLSFKQLSPSSTTGQLTIIKHDGTPLFTGQLDITSEIEMQALLKLLALKDSRVSTFKVKQRLYALAELLKPGFGIHNSAGETAYENMNRNAELNTTQILLAGGFANENINSNAKLSVSGSRQNFTPDEALYREMVEGYKEFLKTFGLEESPEIGKRAESGKLKKLEPIVLPVKGLNIPFADVALRDGDSVIVERFREPLITVVGLVNRAGNFPYPPDVKYNLMHALGFAGGLLLSAEPRYATVYRLRADGTTVSAAFNIVGVAKNADPTDALSVRLKPYDVVAVQHTPRTRAKVFWDRVFRMYITTYIRMEDIIGED